VQWLLKATLACTLPLIFADLAAAQRNRAACREAIDRYNSAINDISSYVRRYANCVSNSRGRDNCYSEFRRLKSAQDDFESAVSNYRSDCEVRTHPTST
jgi:tetratricopeptide (TPR) repeat protein